MKVATLSLLVAPFTVAALRPVAAHGPVARTVSAVAAHGPVARTVGMRAATRPALAPLAAAALACAPAIARADFDLMAEINKPPITLNPFSIQPLGYAFFVLYGISVGWSLFRPASDKELEIQAKADEAAVAAAAAAGPFLSSAASEEGAVTTPSGLIYREVDGGSGESPTKQMSVTVHYTGTLADGTKFDSSYDRGEPSTFKVAQVIPGWQEGLQMMKAGGKAVLTVPAQLGYGAMGNPPKIAGNSALRFEVELIKVEEGGFQLPF